MKIIGIGAAGNKACQALVYHSTVKNIENCLLMNSTEKDFPKEASKNCVLIENIGGCGKEREVGQEIMRSYLENPQAREHLDEFLGDDTHLVLVGSMGGGTGSGGLNMLAKYARNVLGMDVTLIAFKGFIDDIREMKNTLDFLKEVPNNIAVQIIDNSAFLKQSQNNKVEAEYLANFEFSQRISFMLANRLIASEQNIDSNDLYKIITTPGYQMIEKTVFKDIKNKDQMNEIIKNMIDNSTSLPTEPGCLCMGVILNVQPKTLNSFDFDYNVINKAYSGEITPEKFPHIQYCENSGDDTEWLALIVSGLKLPIKELQKLHTEFARASQKLESSNKDPFFDVVQKLDTNKMGNSKRFGHGVRRARNKVSSIEDIDSFLNEIRTGESKPSNGTFTKNNF